MEPLEVKAIEFSQHCVFFENATYLKLSNSSEKFIVFKVENCLLAEFSYNYLRATSLGCFGKLCFKFLSWLLKKSVKKYSQKIKEFEKLHAAQRLIFSEKDD